MTPLTVYEIAQTLWRIETLHADVSARQIAYLIDNLMYLKAVLQRNPTYNSKEHRVMVIDDLLVQAMALLTEHAPTIALTITLNGKLYVAQNVKDGVTRYVPLDKMKREEFAWSTIPAEVRVKQEIEATRKALEMIVLMEEYHLDPVRSAVEVELHTI